MGTKRLEYIDLCKCFAIFCVLLGHSVQYCGNGTPTDNFLWSGIYAFHMPLFMMLSGFFLGKSFTLSFKEFLIKKIRQLIIPSILFYLCINLPIELIHRAHGFSPYEFSLSLIRSVWFLKALFVCYILAYLSKKLMKNDIIASLISIFVVFCIGHIKLFNVYAMLPFFWCGYFFSKHKETIYAHQRAVLSISAIISCLLLSFWKGSYTVYFTPPFFQLTLIIL